VQIEQLNGKDRLSLTPLDKLDEPLSLVKLREQVESLLPRVDLLDAILEIHALTGFADEFAHIKATFHRASLGARERICVWPIAHKSRVPFLPGIPTLFLLISSYTSWGNSADPALCQCQGYFRLRIILSKLFHLILRWFPLRCSLAIRAHCTSVPHMRNPGRGSRKNL
jgi:hypothetical protein